MTYAQSRSVHPVHVQYLKNLGVTSSFSLSIVVDGKLWGLIACHHFKIKYLSFSVRLFLEELSRLASMRINLFQNAIKQIDRERRYQLLYVLREEFGMHENFDLKKFKSALKIMSKILDFDELYANFGGVFEQVDLPVSPGELQKLWGFFEGLSRNQVTFWNTIPTQLKENKELSMHVAGGIFIPLGSYGSIAFLRKEKIEKVSWAGKPNRLSDQDRSEEALNPRTSFAVWVEEVRGKALEWTDNDIEFANLIKMDLITYLGQNQIRKSAFHFFDSSLVVDRNMNVTEQAELSMALEQNKFHIVYQPIVDFRSGKIVGLESFVRWVRISGETLEAALFWGKVEHLHLTVAVGSWVIQRVFQHVKSWQNEGLVIPAISINIGGAQFNSHDIYGLIIEMRKKHNITTEWLRLEINQEDLMRDPELIDKKLRALHQLGVLVYLDRFGSGYLALDYLSNLPLGAIKLDGKLFQFPSIPQQLAMLNVAVGICETLSFRVIASQLTDKENLKIAIKNKILIGQGYVFAKPEMAEDAKRWLSPEFAFNIDKIIE